MRVIDSHTEGEPTRLVIAGGPDLGAGPLAERAARFARDHAPLRDGILLEPRGHDAIVGALLVEPDDPGCVAGVIFFNPAGNLGMCGHAAIGTAVTLAHMGRIGPGQHRLQTPVGTVTVDLHSANEVSITNVESYRHLKGVRIEVPGLGTVRGDVAWGGNWFFLTEDAPCAVTFANIAALTDATMRMRDALAAAGITGAGGAYIDHIEVFGPSSIANSRNFVLCPGSAYDRSPCGTGCSAKIACLAEDGKIFPGQEWVQESIIGSTYRLRHEPAPGGGVIPTVTGRAWVTAEAVLHFDPTDPYATGIRAS
jgi:4-hydroxyproline epimerase